jgi:protein-disulfide isomerase
MENNTQQKLSTPMAIIAAGFLIMMGIIITKLPPQKDALPNKEATTQEETNIVIAPVTASDHVRGDLATAEVLIVEYSDLECPFCKNFHKSLNTAMAKYPGKIAWVYRHFPLDMHPKALVEARATECVASLGGNDAFWKYVDNIFEVTPANNGFDLSLLPTLATKVGVDKSAFDKCFAEDTFDAKIEAQIKDGEKAGVQGTPHSIIVTKEGKQYPIKGADEDTLNSTLEMLLK